jgi:hypothetical protein
LRNRPSQCPVLVTIHDILENKIANCIGLLHDVAFIKAFPTFSKSYRFWHMCKRNLIYCHEESTAFRAPILTKPTNTQLHNVHISYTKSIQIEQ